MSDRDKVCQPCLDRAARDKWYPFTNPLVAATSEECGFHPRLDNWRLYRTLATVQHFSQQPEGWKDRRAPTAITLEAGLVHRRNLECIVFDYEKALLDYALEQGLIEQTDHRNTERVLPRSVRLSAKGDDALRTWVQAGRNDAGATAAQKHLASLVPSTVIQQETA
ncbi:MAG: hypothetical protein LC623_05725 [Halobacteriales archaeon]|nr:hypothetical protein [Halobacteriales archaeon]